MSDVSLHELSRTIGRVRIAMMSIFGPDTPLQFSDMVPEDPGVPSPYQGLNEDEVRLVRDIDTLCRRPTLDVAINRMRRELRPHLIYALFLRACQRGWLTVAKGIRDAFPVCIDARLQCPSPDDAAVRLACLRGTALVYWLLNHMAALSRAGGEGEGDGKPDLHGQCILLETCLVVSETARRPVRFLRKLLRRLTRDDQLRAIFEQRNRVSDTPHILRLTLGNVLLCRAVGLGRSDIRGPSRLAVADWVRVALQEQVQPPVLMVVVFTLCLPHRRNTLDGWLEETLLWCFNRFDFRPFAHGLRALVSMFHAMGDQGFLTFLVDAFPDLDLSSHLANDDMNPVRPRTAQWMASLDAPDREAIRVPQDQVATCPICWAAPETLRTSCGHGFCRPCMCTYLSTPGPRGATCPACRQTITHLTAIHSVVCEEEKEEEKEEEEPSRRSRD